MYKADIAQSMQFLFKFQQLFIINTIIPNISSLNRLIIRKFHFETHTKYLIWLRTYIFVCHSSFSFAFFTPKTNEGNLLRLLVACCIIWIWLSCGSTSFRLPHPLDCTSNSTSIYYAFLSITCPTKCFPCCLLLVWRLWQSFLFYFLLVFFFFSARQSKAKSICIDAVASHLTEECLWQSQDSSGYSVCMFVCVCLCLVSVE